MIDRDRYEQALVGKYIIQKMSDRLGFGLDKMREDHLRLVERGQQDNYAPGVKTPTKRFGYLTQMHRVRAYEYDVEFPLMIKSELMRLGVKNENIDIALELNADLWRKPAMLKTFDEAFYSFAKPQKFTGNFADWQDLRKHHAEVWLQAREFDHYMDNKAVIDILGMATPAMKMAPAEVVELNTKLQHYTREWVNLSVKIQSQQTGVQSNVQPNREM